MYYVYFLRSNTNNKSYVGETEKIPVDRLKEHNSGSNSWTRANGPFRLLYYEEYVCKDDAMKRELFYNTGVGRRVRNAIISEMSKDL